MPFKNAMSRLGGMPSGNSKGEYKIRPYEINPTGRNDDQGHIFFVGNRLNGLSQMHESNIVV